MASESTRGALTIPRDTTSFPAELTEAFRELGEGPDEWKFLKYYQRLVLYYTTKVRSGARGILCVLEMGMGKSIVGASIAVENIGTRPVIMMMAKSLENNMRDSIKKYVNLRAANDPRFVVTDVDAWMQKHFSFVSMNASNMFTQLGRAARGRAMSEIDAAFDSKIGQIISAGSLEGKTIVIDEFHNLVRAIVNGSKNGTAFYDLVMKTRDIVLVFLTGTPISNDPFELAIAFNMLAGRVVLPESYREFYKYYVDKTTNTIANKAKFQNRVFGLVSMVKIGEVPGAAFGREAAASGTEFPERRPTNVTKIPMDPDQYMQYSLAKEAELAEGQSTANGKMPVRDTSFADYSRLMKPKGGMASTYKVRTRQLGNVAIPAAYRDRPVNDIPADVITSPKFRFIKDLADKHRGQLMLVYSQFTGPGGLAALAKSLEDDGWTRHGLSAKGIIDEVPAEEIGDIAASDDNLKVGGGSRDHENVITGGREGVGDFYAGPSVPTVDEIMNGWRSGGAFAADDRDPEERDDDFDSAADGLGEVGHWFGGGLEWRFTRVAQDRLEVFQGNDPLARGFVKVDGLESVSAEVFREDGTIMGDVEAAGVLAAADEWMQRVEHETIVDPDRKGGAAAKDQASKPRETRKFALITGEVPVADRAAIVADHNSAENTHGGIIDMILVSSTGAEGLDLKHGRVVVVLEPYWTDGRHAQIIARYVRNESHIDMPAEEKNVTPYILLAVPPAGEREDIITTDIEIYTEARKNMGLIQSFVDAIGEVSIECLANGGAHCRTCAPTGERLFSNDPGRDITLPDPCRELVEKKVRAVAVTVGEAEYRYMIDADTPFGYRIFAFDQKVRGYVPMSDKDPRFLIVLDAIMESGASSTPAKSPKAKK